MKNFNLLYDATIFAKSYIKGSSNRTGIFFAAYNTLKYLADDPQFIITLYIRDNFNNIKYFKKDILLSQFPVCINSKETPLFNIGVHKNNIKMTHNIIKIIFYSLRIIKNYLFMIFFYKNNSSFFKTIDIFFSPLNPANNEFNIYPSIKHFIIFHDMIPVISDKDSVNSDTHWFNFIVKALNKDTYYFCNSNHTKQDFLKYYGNQLDEKKVIVIHHATSQKFLP